MRKSALLCLIQGLFMLSFATVQAVSTTVALYGLEGSVGPVGSPVTGVGASAVNLDVFGDPQYIADDAPSPVSGSTSVSLDGSGDYLQSVAGDVPTTAIDNIGMEAWVKANSYPAFSFAANLGFGGGHAGGFGILAQDFGSGMKYHILYNGVGIPASSTTLAVTGEWIHLAAVIDGGTARLFVNGVEEDTGSGLPAPINADDHMTIGGNPWDVPNGVWNGLIDYVRIFTFNPGEFSISDLSYENLEASEPKPSNMASDVSTGSVDLSWTPGDTAVSHDVYMGTDPGSLVFKDNVSTPLYRTAPLDLDTTYYWRIDEVESPSVTYTGDVWSFTTRSPLDISTLFPDFDGNCRIGVGDLQLLALDWLQADSPANLIGSSDFGLDRVGLDDFSVLAYHWGEECSTFAVMLSRMKDRDRLAVFPNDEYSFTHYQSSSHDPRNPSLTSLGLPSGHANVDFSNYIRWEMNDGRKEWILMEDTGPGIVTRMWVTGDLGSTLRIYIDGDPTPVFEGTPNPTVAPNSLFGSVLSFKTRGNNASGHNLYAPIPYAQSIKMTYDAVNPHGEGDPDGSPPEPTHQTAAMWYIVEYEKIHGGATVTSYAASQATEHQSLIADVSNVLSTPAVSGDVSDSYSVTDQSLSDGQSLSHNLTGSGAIRHLKVNISGTDQVAAIQNCYVSLTFDGLRTAYVPAAHFFGNGNSDSGSNPYNESQDYYRHIESNGDMSCYWVMPYQSSAQVSVVNESGQTVQVDLDVDSGAWSWNADSMYFHAEYNQEYDILTRSQPWPGTVGVSGYSGNGSGHWNYVTLRGRGVYMGDTLSISNSTGGWWGEGDEKIYVDYQDENEAAHNAFPNIRGTGTEDYYGYAFGHAELYQTPFINQPIAKGNSGGGLTLNSRVRVLDTIPFSDSFKFDMELWSWGQGRFDHYAATAYWYGVADAVSLKPVADLAADFRSGSAGQTAQQAGMVDTAGDGTWTLLASDQVNASAGGADVTDLTWGAVGNAGNAGYGGGQNGDNLPAISDQYLYTDGDANEGVQGKPGYHEVAMHPAGNTAPRPYLVARWTAGAESAGLININGSIRNFINSGDSIDFHILVNGVEKFAVTASGPKLAETPFDFDTTVNAGDTVDFVLGNSTADDIAGDESILRAYILAD